MAAPELGTLTEVSLRDAWVHEAHSFTPWLAEHLDSLANVIGIPLELQGREITVETFAADILARNPLDDSLVLIENQLEGTDHTHLGQIMTYLAGLDAHTVVWIAANFREPHLSALKWLNDHTVDPFAFFAVKVKAVRIGDSPIAPVFEVVVRPNGWERRLQAAAQEARPLSSIGQFRRDFWSYYLDRFPDEAVWGPADGASFRRRTIESAGLAVTLYLAQKEVGVFVRGPRGVASQDVYDQLAPFSNRLAQLTGVGIGTPENGHYFVTVKPGTTSERDAWAGLADWLHGTAGTYETVLRELFEEQN